MTAPPSSVPAGIALGSNLGDRRAELEAGFAFLRSLSIDSQIRRSSIIETEPVDCPPGSQPFLNAVAEIQVDPAKTSPRKLLAQLQDFEVQRGRARRHGRNSPRPLDLDLLYVGDLVLNEPDLILPHPRIAERPFVLQPLDELRPDFVLPGQELSVRELLFTGKRAEPVVGFGMDYREHLQKIEHLAYTLWEREGRPEGRAMANWLRAEKMLSDEAFLEHELEVEEEEGGLIPTPGGKTSPPLGGRVR